MNTRPTIITAIAGMVFIIAAVGVTMRKNATLRTQQKTQQTASTHQRLASINSKSWHRSARRTRTAHPIDKAQRAALVAQADEALLRGRRAYAERDYQTAYDEYTEALQLLPRGSMLAARRQSYSQHLGDVSIALAQQHRRVGKYDEARSLLESVLRRDPTNIAAEKQLEYLDDPIRVSPALTFEHQQNVNRVRKLLYMGEGYCNLGKYDEARNQFTQVLQIDPYNKTARRWLERVAAMESKYHRGVLEQIRRGEHIRRGFLNHASDPDSGSQ